MRRSNHYARWIRPVWVVYTMVLVGLGGWGVATALGARPPLLALIIAPALAVGLVLVVLAFVPPHRFEDREVEDGPSADVNAEAATPRVSGDADRGGRETPHVPGVVPDRPV